MKTLTHLILLLTLAIVILANSLTSSYASIDCHLSSLLSGDNEITEVIEELASLKLEIDSLASINKPEMVSNLEEEFATRLTQLHGQLSRGDYTEFSLDDLHRHIATIARNKQAPQSKIEHEVEIRKKHQQESEDTILWNHLSFDIPQEPEEFIPVGVVFDQEGKSYHFAFNNGISTMPSHPSGHPALKPIPLINFKTDNWLKRFAVTPDGKTIVMATSGSVVQVGRLGGQGYVFQRIATPGFPFKHGINAIALSKDGQTLFLAGEELLKVALNTPTPVIHRINTDEIESRFLIQKLALDENNGVLYIAKERSLAKVDLKQKDLNAEKIEYSLPGEDVIVQRLHSSKNGKIVVLFKRSRVGFTTEKEGKIDFKVIKEASNFILEIKNGNLQKRELRVKEPPFHSGITVLSPDGRYLALVGKYPFVNIVDLNSSARDLKSVSFNFLEEFPHGSPSSGAISYDNNQLLLSNRTAKSIAIYNLRSLINELFGPDAEQHAEGVKK